MITSERLLTMADVRDRLRVGAKTLRRLVREEGLPTVAVGKRQRVRPADLDGWLAARGNRTEGGEP